MHGIYELKDRVIEELEQLGTRGDFSRSDLPTIDMLAHTAKNLCKVISMCEEMTGYSYGGGRRYGGYSRDGKYAGNFYGEYSGARNRDSYGRYSRDTDWMVETLHEMRDKAPNDQMRKEFDEFIMRMDRVK